MKRILYFIFAASIILSCNPSKREFNILQNNQLPGLASSVKLNIDTTIVFLADYFPKKTGIDSIVTNKHLSHHHNKENYTLRLIVLNDSLPNMSVLKVFINDYEYDIPVRKSRKIKYTFAFEPSAHFTEKYDMVQLMGEFNAWNPRNTLLEKNNNKWMTELIVEPGKYQYLIVADGKQMLDPTNNDSVSNNMGGFNSVLEIGNKAGNKKPRLYTTSYTGNEITVGSENNASRLFAFYNNRLIPKNWIKKENGHYKIPIPVNTKKKTRAYIRVWACNNNGISNGLLIPLQKGKVLNDPGKLKRTDFEATVLYNVFIDRFYDGDTSNTEPVDDPSIHPKANYHGGDLAGVIKKIKDGYFDSLGINTIWISPIVKNPKGAYGLYPEPKTTFSAYHGYWPISFTEIDERFGTGKELHKLVKLAHESNMNVLLDFVANHVHEEHPVYKKNKDWATDLYLPDGTLNTEKWDSHRLTTWFDVFLPTLDLSKPGVYEMLTDSAVYWIKKYNLDGFRHDATKHIPEVFWRTLTRKLKTQVVMPQNKKLYQIGETYGTPGLIGSYVSSGQLDAQFDFNVYDAISTTLALDKNFKNVANELEKSAKYYGSHHLMGNITGNQDRARFISYASGALSFDEDAKKAGWTREIKVKDPVGYKKAAMLNAIVTTIPGLPVIYYGDEIGMPGGNDPDNRRMMRFKHLKPKEKSLRQTTSKLIKFRRNSLPLVYGDFKVLKANEEVMAYQRTYFNKMVIVVINNSNKAKNVDIDINPRYEANKLKARFNDSKISGEDSHLHVRLNAHSFEILSYDEQNN